LNAAATILKTLQADADYTNTMNSILPGTSLSGSAYMNAGPPSPTEWLHSINTMMARNILVNSRVTALQAADWNNILTLTSAGLGPKEIAFVVRSYSDDTKAPVGKDDGTVGRYAALGGSGGYGSSTYFISERFVQDFRAGDNRLTQNIGNLGSSTFINARGRGINFGTRWYLIDGGSGLPNTYVYCHTSQTGVGVDDTYIGPSYEENLLMAAEANIRLNNVDAGLAFIDKVRDWQGSGLTHIAGTGLTQAQALEELRSERRVALFDRGLAFYDMRRMGYLDDVSKGGGRSKAVVLSKNPAGGYIVNVNATINYNYLSYFDVPATDVVFNPPATGSAPIVFSPN